MAVKRLAIVHRVVVRSCGSSTGASLLDVSPTTSRQSNSICSAKDQGQNIKLAEHVRHRQAGPGNATLSSLVPGLGRCDAFEGCQEVWNLRTRAWLLLENDDAVEDAPANCIRAKYVAPVVCLWK